MKMKLIAETVTSDGKTISYTLFEDVNRIYVEPVTNGISFAQDEERPGFYCISEGVILGGKDLPNGDN